MAFSGRSRKYKNKADVLCYICGVYTIPRLRRNISLFVKRAYKAYFQVPLGDQDKKWAPHIVCHNCEEMLRDWTKGKRKGLLTFWCIYGVAWTEGASHFCLVNTKGIGKKNRQNFSYPSIPSAIRSVLHSDEFPPPVINGFLSSEDEETGSEEERMDLEYKKTDP